MAIRSNAKSAQNNTLSTTVVGGILTGNRRLTRGLGRVFAIGCLGFAVVSTGCTMSSGVCRAFGQSDCIDDFMIGYRNKAMAEKAWHCNKHRFCDKQHAAAFKDGFVQGYAEVANGGNGCVPAVAPSEYWGWRYQSSQGQGAVNAWFEGFPMGVQAAEEDGVGHWQTVRPTGSFPAAAAAAPALMPAFQPANDGVANPFYSEQEYVPAPTAVESDEDEGGEDDDEMDLDAEDVGEDLDADTVFGESPHDFPVVSEDRESTDLVSQSDIAKSHEAAVATMVNDDSDNSGIAIDDIFGTASESVADSETVNVESEELPFSFE